MNWNWNQYKAYGRNVLSYTAGATTVAVAWGLLSQTDASAITEDMNAIYNGLMEIAKGVTGLVSIAVPLYTGWRAAHSASPNEQAKSVAANVNQVTDGARLAVINSVGNMPEVQKVVATLNVARNTESTKVVTN
jgi:hypothetical protein